MRQATPVPFALEIKRRPRPHSRPGPPGAVCAYVATALCRAWPAFLANANRKGKPPALPCGLCYRRLIRASSGTRVLEMRNALPRALPSGNIYVWHGQSRIDGCALLLGFRRCAFHGGIHPPNRTSVHYMHIPALIIGTASR